jgi:integrase/recombinase XerD
MFKAKPIASWEIIEKDVIDEIIFRTDNQRNRLMLELMARGGMRVGEVLKLTRQTLMTEGWFSEIPKAAKERKSSLFPRKWLTGLKPTSKIRASNHLKGFFPYPMKPPG